MTKRINQMDAIRLVWQTKQKGPSSVWFGKPNEHARGHLVLESNIKTNEHADNHLVLESNIK